jgi:hypothetical protein
MAKNTRPDGSPGVAADGHARRRADGWESPPGIGWLNGSPVAKVDPQGSEAIPYGPGSKLWNRTSRPTTKPKG